MRSRPFRDASRRQATEGQAEREVNAAISAHNRRVEELAHLYISHSAHWDWEEIAGRSAPARPKPREVRHAQARLDAFQPGRLDRILGRAERKRARLARELSDARKQHLRAIRKHLAEVMNIVWLRKLAAQVLAADPIAQAAALRIDSPLQGIPLIKRCSAECHGSSVEADVWVRDRSIIPEQMPRVLKSGRLSWKRIPDRLRSELYRDHVIKALIRVANEIYRRLPIEDVYAHALGPVYDREGDVIRRGLMASVKFQRQTLAELLDELEGGETDISEALSHFTHRAKFTLRHGFESVEKLEVS